MSLHAELYEFAQHSHSALVSKEILQIFSDSLGSCQSIPEKLQILKQRIAELESLSNKIQQLFKQHLDDKMCDISSICNTSNVKQGCHSVPPLFYLNFLNKLNAFVKKFAEYQNVQTYMKNIELINHITNINSAYGFHSAMENKFNSGILGQKSRERIVSEFNRFVAKENEISKFLLEFQNNAKFEAQLNYIFVKKTNNWVVSNNPQKINCFIANCILSNLDNAIVKRIDIAIQPYLYEKVQITESDNPFKNASISASQSLLALSRTLAFLTDLHLQIKSLDSFLLDFDGYISNRLMKWLNLLLISLIWDQKGLYDIVHVGLLILYFVRLRSFLLPELACTVKCILGKSLVNVNDVKSGNEWDQKLASGGEYQTNPYKGWTPGKSFKGIFISPSSSALELSSILYFLKQSFD